MKYIPREAEREICRWLDEREIIAIRGPRQAGKTTLLMKLRERLLSRGVEEKNIHYINFEDDVVRIKFEEDCREFVKFHLESGKNYFLFDEVQYVKDVGKKLKLVFDAFAGIKIIITGSSSFDLTNLGKYLVGRVVFFDLYPFSFGEFLRSKGEKYRNLYKDVRIGIEKPGKPKQTVFLDELNRFLHEYLTFGSYPRIVMENNRKKKAELLRNLFITYIEKDIASVYGMKYRERVTKLLKALVSVMGNPLKYETLSELSGLKYHEVKEILSLLQDSFVISVVRPFHRNLITELRKNPKVYFVDYGFANYLKENLENPEFEKLYENFVHNEISRRGYNLRYWRTAMKTEVDFVIEKGKKVIPIEVKTSPKITRAFRSFVNHYRPESGFIANLSATEKQKVDGADVFFVPFVCL